MKNKYVSFFTINKMKLHPGWLIAAAVYAILPIFLIGSAITEENSLLLVFDYELQELIYGDRIAAPLSELFERCSYSYFPVIAGILTAFLPMVLLLRERYLSNCRYTLLRLPVPRDLYYIQFLVLPFLAQLFYLFSQWIICLVLYGIYCGTIPQDNRTADTLWNLFQAEALEALFPFVHPVGAAAACSILMLPAAAVVLIYQNRTRNNQMQGRTTMLEFQKVNMSYTFQPVLRDISFQIGAGEIIGLLGENGAGKTTILKLILGLIKQKYGSILLDGHPITHSDMERFAFATSEHSHFPQLTAQEHASFYAEQFPKFNQKRFRTLMDFFRLPYDKKMKQLSMGQKNQIETVLALSQGADFILLDQPFASNDIFIREDFYKLVLGLLEPNETIILSTHLIEEVQNFISRVILLKDKEIAADVTAEQLEEYGLSLKEFIAKTYHRSADKVMEVLGNRDISGGKV